MAKLNFQQSSVSHVFQKSF